MGVAHSVGRPTPLEAFIYSSLLLRHNTQLTQTLSLAVSRSLCLSLSLTPPLYSSIPCSLLLSLCFPGCVSRCVPMHVSVVTYLSATTKLSGPLKASLFKGGNILYTKSLIFTHTHTHTHTAIQPSTPASAIQPRSISTSISRPTQAAIQCHTTGPIRV